MEEDASLGRGRPRDLSGEEVLLPLLTPWGKVKGDLLWYYWSALAALKKTHEDIFRSYGRKTEASRETFQVFASWKHSLEALSVPVDLASPGKVEALKTCLKASLPEDVPELLFFAKVFQGGAHLGIPNLSRTYHESTPWRMAQNILAQSEIWATVASEAQYAKLLVHLQCFWEEAWAFYLLKGEVLALEVASALEDYEDFWENTLSGPTKAIARGLMKEKKK